MDLQVSPKVTVRHFMMLKYWHRMANSDLKELYRLPEVGETIEGLQRRKLNELDLRTIELCFYELRESLIKMQDGQTMDVCH